MLSIPVGKTLALNTLVSMKALGQCSTKEMPLYFQEPKQLLDIFTSLEESNLFLIQNSQAGFLSLLSIWMPGGCSMIRIRSKRSKSWSRNLQQCAKHERQQGVSCISLATTTFESGYEQQDEASNRAARTSNHG